MKKFFAIIMSMLMIVCFMPTAAFAADGSVINETELVNAINNAKDGDIITLGANITIDKNGSTTYSDVNRLEVKANNVTIDLNEHTLTIPNHTLTLTGQNITLKNGKIIATTTNNKQPYGSYAVAATGTGTIVNQVEMTGGVSATGYLPDETPYNNEASVTITNCTISAGQFYAVCAQGNADATISNSTLKTIDAADEKAGSTAFFWIENSSSSIAYDASSVTLIGDKPLYNKVGCKPNVTVKDADGNSRAIETVEVNTEDALKTAVAAGQNVMLTSDIELSAALEIKQSVTIVGNGRTKLVRENKNSNTERVIDIDAGVASGLSDITLTLVGVDIVGPTGNGFNRGISIWGVNNLTVIMDRCTASANHYALNIAGENINPKVIVRNTTLTGYSAFQTWSAGTNATFENCTLIGINQWSGSSDDFATIVINEDVKPAKLTFKNCNIKAEETGSADEKLLSVRESGATVTFDNCQFFVEDNEVSDIKEAISEMEWEDGAYIAKRTGSAGSYTYTVLPKANLTGGVYMSDPTGALASKYYVSSTDGGVWTVSYAGGGSSSSTTTTTDTVTNTTEDKKTDTSADTGSTTETAKVATTTATVKTETKTAADGTKTVAATVDTTTASKIVEKAVENKSEEVVIDTATTSSTGTAAVTETAAGTTTKVDLPEQTVKAIAEKTEAAVTIKSDAAEIKLDTEAVKAVAEQAGETGTVNLVVETVAQNETKVEVDLKLVTSKGTVSDFKGGSVSVTVKLNTALAAKPVVCVYIDDNGTYHKVKGVKNADGTYTFETGHFSTYAVMAEEEADEVIAEQTAKVNEMVSALTLKARSAKTAKGNIKVTLTANEDAIKAIEDLGYTVKYKFYRSTKKSASYKAKLEGANKTYTNTTGKKGTKYYYKARVMVYDAQGELIAKTALKQCRYAARTK